MGAQLHEIRSTTAGSVRSSAPARQAGAVVALERGATVSAHPRWASTVLVKAERVRRYREIDLATLSPRTILVARYIAGGMIEKEIATLFGTSRSVIRRERQRFEEAAAAVTRRDIVLACRQLGLSPL